ncbi:uncharacterized protein LOC106065782 isoform X1 [Biomphalaria glabrata]|uniref:Uncharacterized protein LOC106065782 isoform X1 n=1 Tax=Biomphalaria glabrata TaxID=6526 RepID=A0A9W3AAH2_BIOGL|nr:uncharacterized protein LOC106065782 isoform X1 [Biomphalaria glabrata]
MTTSQTATVTSTRRTSKSVPNLSTDISNLFEAIGEGKIETVKVILEMAKDPAELLRMKDLQGLTPLRKAVALNKAEIARILVAYGAEPSVRDPAGRTVLHIAVMQGRRELIAPLLVSKDSCVNVQDSHGWSPLHFAVRGKHIHAINWLLYAGADISLKNKEDKTAMDLCDEDSPIRAMLAKYERALDDGPLDLCSSFIGRKQLNQIGPDGLLMFVTSSIWSERMQFIFCIRIRPYRAMPPIPLRLDEQYYSDVWHYRMMRRLSPKETRVKAYFRLFEELIDTEIVLKITSKRKFLGEIPFTLSKYTQFNYTSFLAGAEMDLKDEGQFVMVKRPISYMLLKDQDGIYSNRHCGMFKFNLPDGVLPNPPPEWNNTRYDREWEEAEAMMKKLLPETESETNEATVTEKQVVWGDRNMNADAAPDVEATPEGGKGAEDGKDGAGGEEKEPGENEEEEEEEEDWPGGIRPGTILEGDEPDECADFYFISKGWALYLQLLHPLPLHMLIDKSIFERNAIRCITDFYKVFHTSNKQPTEKCMMQIPKTPEFVRVGTILVFARRELFPDEVEFPDPDDTPEEYFLSSDGKNTWGAYWILKEKERWSVIPSGLVNKQSRLIFETKTLTTFIAMQLTHGSQKWESELPGDSSSEEEEEEEAVEVKEGEGEEEPKEEVVEEEGEESAEKKKKKKKKKPMSEIKVQESADDSSNDEIEGSVTEFTFNPVDGSNGSRRETAGGSMIMEAPPESSSPQLQGSPSGSPQMTPQMKPSKQATDHDKKDISPNKTRSSLRRKSSKVADGQQSGRGSSVRIKDDAKSENDASNNRTDMNNSQAPVSLNTSLQNAQRPSTAYSVVSFDDEEEILAPEQRTVVSGLPPLESSYYSLSGMKELRRPHPKPRPVVEAQKTDLEEIPEEAMEEPAAEKPEEAGEGEETVEVEEVESDEGIVLKRERMYSIVQIKDDGSIMLEDFKFGPPLTELSISDADMSLLLTEVAYLWRYRNHCECVASIFSRFRDGVYDLAIELVKASELYVRAENWWGEGYRMIAQTPTFPAKSGRLFNFLLDGPMVVESPVTHVTGSVSQRSMFYYLSTVSCLEYVVKKATKDEDVKPGGAKKGPRKKDDKADQEPDCRLDIMQYSPGSRTNGLDIASLNIFLNAADLWHQRHVELRSSDNVLLNSLIKILKKEKAFKHKWWRIVLLLGYPEKEIETEKGKTKWSVIIANLLTKWFEDNLNAPDRGILKLISVLSIMELHNTIESLLSGIRDYKGTLLTSKKEPRYLKLLFHWVLNTKITRNNIMRLIDPQILKPVSDIFLLRMSLLLDPGQIYKIGAAMDVEDNVIHAVQDEESIKDSVYFPFRVLIKSRQKKDEIIHYTLLLLEMTKQCNFQEAQQFLITETKKWMITVAETEPDICAKLDNVFS